MKGGIEHSSGHRSAVRGAIDGTRALTVDRPVARIVYAFAEFLFLALLSLIPPVAGLIDFLVLENGSSEYSITEWLQELLLAASAAMMGFVAWGDPRSRGFFVLLAGLFTCMLIREFDFFLDHVFPGFWFWPALLTAIAASVYAIICCRGSLLHTMADFMDTKPFVYMLFGLTVVLIFSRLFGSGAFFWQHLMGSGYDPAFKTALQEGLELFGYLFVAWGAWLTPRCRNAS